jgi:hypothetical protein
MDDCPSVGIQFVIRRERMVRAGAALIATMWGAENQVRTAGILIAIYSKSKIILWNRP